MVGAYLYNFFNVAIAQKVAINKLKEKEIYPSIRNTTSPSHVETPKINSPSFQWHSKKKTTYSIRIATSKNFVEPFIEKK